jgi:hypothetical protein
VGTNTGGSLYVRLDRLPVNGQLHIHDRKEQEPATEQA